MTDMLIGGYVQSFERTNFLSHSIMFGQDDITWCVRRSNEIPAYFNIYKIVDLTCSVIFLISFYSFCVAFYIFWAFDEEENYQHRDIIYITLLVVLPAIFGLNINQSFKATSHKTRIIYALIGFTGFLNAIIYSSLMLSFCTSTYRAKQLSNFDELIRNGYELRCTPTTFAMITYQTKVNINVFH